ncbi:MAG: hypothetical protein FJY98_01480 [Candidatus Liptonbacteria bacterium]|nr:hypothetical protein [Candidatus Liptonbacteria bacterium]
MLGIDYNQPRSGQVMVISIVAIAGIFLGVTVVAGLLMISQLRQSADFKASTNAIAAADSGIEWALYRYTRATSTAALPATLSNRASVEVKCFDELGAELKKNGAPDCQSAKTRTIHSYGTFSGATRIFEVSELGSFAPR